MKGSSVVLLVLFGFIATSVAKKEEKKSEAQKPRDSNRSLLTQLQQAEASGAGSGAKESEEILLEKMPKFKSKAEEIKWKMNKARKKLKIAKQFVALAKNIDLMRKNGKRDSKAVKDVIRRAEIALVHAGEHMGLDYVHFKK